MIRRVHEFSEHFRENYHSIVGYRCVNLAGGQPQEFSIARAILADLMDVMGTSNDVLALVSSGTGAIEASISNLFSPGDRVNLKRVV